MNRVANNTKVLEKLPLINVKLLLKQIINVVSSSNVKTWNTKIKYTKNIKPNIQKSGFSAIKQNKLIKQSNKINLKLLFVITWVCAFKSYNLPVEMTADAIEFRAPYATIKSKKALIKTTNPGNAMSNTIRNTAIMLFKKLYLVINSGIDSVNQITGEKIKIIPKICPKTGNNIYFVN